MNTRFSVRPAKRLAYAFVGLLAGDAILLLFLLRNAIVTRANLIRLHIGEPTQQIPLAFQMFLIYAAFSLAGWMLVGLPTALFLRAHSITALPWPIKLLVGVALGPFALFVILVVLDHGHIGPGSFRGIGLLWAYASCVSVVSFSVYAALLRREQKQGAGLGTPEHVSEKCPLNCGGGG